MRLRDGNRRVRNIQRRQLLECRGTGLHKRRRERRGRRLPGLWIRMSVGGEALVKSTRLNNHLSRIRAWSNDGDGLWLNDLVDGACVTGRLWPTSAPPNVWVRYHLEVGAWSTALTLALTSTLLSTDYVEHCARGFLRGNCNVRSRSSGWILLVILSGHPVHSTETFPSSLRLFDCGEGGGSCAALVAGGKVS